MPRQRTRHGLKAIQHALVRLKVPRMSKEVPALAAWRSRLAEELPDADLVGKETLATEAAVLYGALAYTTAWILDHRDDLVVDGKLLPIVEQRNKMVAQLSDLLEKLGGLTRKAPKAVSLLDAWKTPLPGEQLEAATTPQTPQDSVGVPGMTPGPAGQPRAVTDAHSGSAVTDSAIGDNGKPACAVPLQRSDP